FLHVALPIFFSVFAYVVCLNNASLTILSQQKGLKSEVGLINYLNAFVVILIVMSFTFSLFGFIFAEPLLLLLDTPSDILPMAKSYLRINFIGVLFLFGYNFVSTVLRSIVDSKNPLKFVSVAVVLNLVLDPFFIAVLDFGVSRAAYATIFSQGFAFIYGLTFVLKNKLAPFQFPRKPKLKEVKLIL